MRKWLTALLTAAMLLAAAPPVRAAGPDIAAPSAILMAVSNAIGTEVKEYPTTPTVVLKAMGKIK